MKIELDLTKEQFELLLNLVFFKYDELNKLEDALDGCITFCDETDDFKEQLKELEKPLGDAKNLFLQVRKYKYPDSEY